MVVQLLLRLDIIVPFIQFAELEIKLFVFFVKLSQDRNDGSNRVSICKHTENHPEGADHSFNLVSCRDVTVPNCGEGLDGPVEGHEVLHEVSLVDSILGHHPAVASESVELSHNEPNTSHQVVDQQHYYKLL